MDKEHIFSEKDMKTTDHNNERNGIIMEKVTQSAKIKNVRNYLVTLTAVGAVCTAALICGALVMFSKGMVGYGVLVTVLALFAILIVYMTARRAAEFSAMKKSSDARVSVWYLSKRSAVASASLELKKMSIDDIITSGVLGIFMLLTGGIMALITKSLTVFLLMLGGALVIVLTVVVLHTLRRRRIAASSGVCIFGEYGVYANGIYHAFCDVGIYGVDSRYSEKNRLLIISYKNKLFGDKSKTYIPVFVPEGYEDEAEKINRFYSEYDSI